MAFKIVGLLLLIILGLVCLLISLFLIYVVAVMVITSIKDLIKVWKES